MIELSNFPISHLYGTAVMLLIFALLVYLPLVGTASLPDWPLFEILARRKKSDKINWIEFFQLYWKEIVALSLFFNAVILVDVATFFYFMKHWCLAHFYLSQY